MKSKKCTLGLLIFYLIALSWIIIFKLRFSIADFPHLRNINLIPFAESVIVNGTIQYDEIIQNLLAFIPYGLFIHILWEDRSLLIQFAPIICTSLFFETVQFIFAIGASDITDLRRNNRRFYRHCYFKSISKKLDKNYQYNQFDWSCPFNIIYLCITAS